MFMFFGKGKCPICGNFGKRVKSNWHCAKCSLQFDEFGLLELEAYPQYTDLWNA